MRLRKPASVLTMKLEDSRRMGLSAQRQEPG